MPYNQLPRKTRYRYSSVAMGALGVLAGHMAPQKIDSMGRNKFKPGITSCCPDLLLIILCMAPLCSMGERREYRPTRKKWRGREHCIAYNTLSITVYMRFHGVSYALKTTATLFSIAFSVSALLCTFTFTFSKSIYCNNPITRLKQVGEF